MPRSFSRMAGRAPRASAWCISSLGNVSNAVPIAIGLLLRAPADSCIKSWHEGHGALDEQRRGPSFPLGKKGGRRGEGNDPLRARLVDGVAADVRLASAGAAAFLRDGVVRGARLRHLVPGQRGLRPL